MTEEVPSPVHEIPADASRRKNRYAAYAKLKEIQLHHLADSLARGVTASTAAKELRLNRNTVNRYYAMFREALARRVDPCLRIVPVRAPLVGLFLGARTVQVQLVPEHARDMAAAALAGQPDAVGVFSHPDWPGYDALGEPATGAFAIMAGCLVGANGQAALATHWARLRARLCRSRGIPRAIYWQHLYVCDLMERLGPEAFASAALEALACQSASSS